MGFVLSLLYFVTNYLTPRVLFGPLAAYRVELILAVLIVIVSVPKLASSNPLRTPQSLALIGLAVAVAMSVTVGARWIGGGVQALLAFIPNAFGFYLLCLHCNSKRKLQILVAMLVFVCLFVMVQGSLDLSRGLPSTGPPKSAATGDLDYQAWDADHPYIRPMRNDAGEWIYRLQGLGEINDPNDFGQLLVSVIPLVFLFWRPKTMLWNLAFTILPTCLFVAGIYLTHSRGALIALAVLALLAARRRIGTVLAAVVSGLIFAVSMALQFTGGREVSVNAGVDRTALWGDSLRLFKSHPFFGVGFGNSPDYLGLTAHNSVAVCAAELGIFGLFFWCLFLFPTLHDALVISSSGKDSEENPEAVATEPEPTPAGAIGDIDKREMTAMGRLILLSLLSFLAAGFFLSRAFVMTLFVLAGMVEVVYSMALNKAIIGRRMKLGRVAVYSTGLAVLLVLALYVTLRVLNGMR